MSIATLTQVSALHSPTLNPHTAPATTTPPPPSGDVASATLNFHSPTTTDGAPPYYHVTPPPTGPQSNVETTAHNVTIRDLRGHEPTFTLDRQSFQPLPATPTALKSFTNDAEIAATYYPEIQAVLKRHLPTATDVVIFDHTIRSPHGTRTPVMRVHVDQTVPASYQRVRQHLPPSRADEVVRRAERVRIINVWRPIGPGPVVDSPLAFADSRSVREEDLVPVRHIYPDREGGTLGVRWAPDQQWWYWGAMTGDDVLLIKCFDTDTVVGGGGEGRRGRTPHTAFEHPDTPVEARGSRQSIEVRCLVIG